MNALSEAVTMRSAIEAAVSAPAAGAGLHVASVAQGETVPHMLRNAVAARRDRVLLRQKELGIWKSLTYGEADAIAGEIGRGLVALGFDPGECASILSNTVKEWVLADWGVLSAGGVSSGIYPTDAPTQVEYLLHDSRSVYVFVEDEEQLDKVLEVRERLPRLRKIVVFDMEGLSGLSDPQVMSLDALRALGRELDADRAAQWEARLDARRPEDLAILIYTSGTTGKPKGAMISHRNILASIRNFRTVLPQDERDERISFLPLCHVAERVFGFYYSVFAGARLNFVENPDTVPENVREIAPTVFLAVPRIWEKFYSTFVIALSEATAFQQWAMRLALGVGQRVADRRERGVRPSLALRAAHRIARFLVLDNVRKSIGIDRCRYLATGAAPISPELIRWYLALGVPMLEIWGMTETTGQGTVTPIDGIRPGMIGRASPMNEVRVDAATGELLVRGPAVFMGYLNQPEKTAETLDAEGWLHTGDVATVDADGYFKITDRMKDIIATSGGKKITPSEIENELKFSPFITDAVVIGNARPYLACLVMIDQENVEKYAQDHDIPFSNYASLCRAPEIQALIDREVQKVNRKFARVEQVKKFRLIDQKLTAEDEELTPTMKLKRSFVNRKYAALIESMYRKD